MKGFGMKELKNLGSVGLRFMNTNLPSILSGCAIFGLVATAVTAFKAAPDVKSALNDKKWDKAMKDDDEAEDSDTIEVESVKLNTWETVTAVAPYVWKPVLCGVFTAGCIVGAHVLTVQRLTMLAGAYKMSETKLKEYESKAKEILGDKKADELHDEVVKEICDVPLAKSEIIYTKHGDTIFFDTWSGRYFTSDEATIRRAESVICNSVACGDFATINDFYEELGLPETKPGRAFGWQAYSSYKAPVLNLRLTPDTVELDGEQRVVWIMDYTANLDDSNFCGRL